MRLLCQSLTGALCKNLSPPIQGCAGPAKLGMEKTAPQRLRAGVSFALQTATDEGHCALPVAMLASLAQKLLEVEAPLIEAAIADELRRSEEVIRFRRRR